MQRSHQQQEVLGRGGSYRQTSAGASWATSKLVTSPAPTSRQRLCSRLLRSQILGRSHRLLTRPYLSRPTIQMLRGKMELAMRRLQMRLAMPQHPTMVHFSSSRPRISHRRPSQQRASGTC